MTEKICECGIKVTGTSEQHLESNMKIHKESKIHKEIIKNLEQIKKEEQAE